MKTILFILLCHFIISLPAHSQETRNITIPNGSSIRARHVVDILVKENNDCEGKWAAYFDSTIKNYNYDYRRKKGWLYHGSYFFINGFGDTTIWGQYEYGQPTGVFIQNNDFNRRLHYIKRYKKGIIQEQKYYHFDDDNKILLSVVIDKNLDSVKNIPFGMEHVSRRVYDSTETWLMREETYIGNDEKRIRTYYRNGRVRKIYQISNGSLFEYAKPQGHYEEYYQNGNRKAIGQYNFGGSPTGEWTYYDDKGNKSVKKY